MVEEIFPDIHRIEVPVHGNPLNAVNSYVIKGGDRNLIIDTALNRAVCATVQTRIRSYRFGIDQNGFVIPISLRVDINSGAYSRICEK